MSEYPADPIQAHDLEEGNEIEGLIISGKGDFGRVLDCVVAKADEDSTPRYIRVAWDERNGKHPFVAQVSKSFFYHGSDHPHSFDELVAALESEGGDAVKAQQFFYGNISDAPEGQMICMSISEGGKNNGLFMPTPEQLSHFLEANGFVISNSEQALVAPQVVEV